MAQWGSMSEGRCILSIPSDALGPAVSEAQLRQAALTDPQRAEAEMASFAKRSRQDVFGCALVSPEEHARKLEAAAAAMQRRIPRPLVNRSTLEDLLERGIPGRMLPLKDFGFSRQDIPCFLKGRGIFCIQVDMGKAFVHGNTPLLHALRRGPTFENICGSVLVYGYDLQVK